MEKLFLLPPLKLSPQRKIMSKNPNVPTISACRFRYVLHNSRLYFRNIKLPNQRLFPVNLSPGKIISTSTICGLKSVTVFFSKTSPFTQKSKCDRPIHFLSTQNLLLRCSPFVNTSNSYLFLSISNIRLFLRQ